MRASTTNRERAGDRADPILVFLHIPRTAGVTLRHLLAGEYERTITIHDPVDPNELAEGLASVEPVQAIQGHLNYGIHELLPRPVRYVTVLRHPIDRVASVYTYFLEHPQSMHASHATDARDLLEFAVTASAAEIENVQTRRLAGAAFADDEGSREMLRAATEHLEHEIEVCGLTERFVETVLLMQKRFGWADVRAVTRHNPTLHRPEVAAVEPEAAEAIARRNELDLQLYEHARRLLEKRVKKQGRRFASEARELEAASQRRQIDDLLAEVARLQDRETARRAEVVDLREKRVDMRKELTVTRRGNAALTAELREARRKLKKLEKQLARLQAREAIDHDATASGGAGS